MSTKPSIGRLTAIHETERFTAIQATERSASTQENSAVAKENDRLALKPKPDVKTKPTVKPNNDRSGLCAFTFADGRQCRTPRYSRNPHFCYFHAQKEAQSQAAAEAGEAVSSFFYGNYLCATDFAAGLGRVFSAVAQGQIDRKTAMSLAYLGQTINHAIRNAQHEYANVMGGAAWRTMVAECLEPSPSAPEPPSQPALLAPIHMPRPEPECATAPTPPSNKTSPSAPSPSPQPTNSNPSL